MTAIIKSVLHIKWMDGDVVSILTPKQKEETLRPSSTQFGLKSTTVDVKALTDTT